MVLFQFSPLLCPVRLDTTLYFPSRSVTWSLDHRCLRNGLPPMGLRPPWLLDLSVTLPGVVGPGLCVQAIQDPWPSGGHPGRVGSLAHWFFRHGLTHIGQDAENDHGMQRSVNLMNEHSLLLSHAPHVLRFFAATCHTLNTMRGNAAL